jgi:hypothetical protein
MPETVIATTACPQANHEGAHDGLCGRPANVYATADGYRSVCDLEHEQHFDSRYWTAYCTPVPG